MMRLESLAGYRGASARRLLVIVLLFGPPGCGKGTQAAFIARRHQIPAISTGEILRAEMQAGTPLGKQASSIMAQGGLVGDDLVNQMVANRVGKPDCLAGFLLDGYPRTVVQAQFFDGLLRELGLPEPVVIHLKAPGAVLVRRLSNRRQCPRCLRIYNLVTQPPKAGAVCDEDGVALIGRPDDAKAVIQERLKQYEELTGPVIAHYRQRRFHAINGNRPPEDVERQIAGLLSESRRRRPMRTYVADLSQPAPASVR
jgi:adenylate kinase